MQEFPWFGKLGLKGKVAETEATLIHTDHLAMELKIRSQAKQTYFDLYATQQALTITRADAAVLQRMETIAATKYSTANGHNKMCSRCRPRPRCCNKKSSRWNNRQPSSKPSSICSMNRRADAPLGLAVTAPTVAAEPDLERLFAIAEKARPEVAKAQADIQRGQSQRDLMQKEFYPDYRSASNTVNSAPARTR